METIHIDNNYIIKLRGEMSKGVLSLLYTFFSEKTRNFLFVMMLFLDILDINLFKFMII